MNHIRKKRFYLIFIIAIIVSVQGLSADMISLKNGGVIIGKIINQTAKEVVINENGATRKVAKATIARILYGDPDKQRREIEAREAAAKQEAEDRRKAEEEQNRRIEASATTAAEETARAQAAAAASALNEQIKKDFAESERIHKERIRQLEERINFLDQRLREHEESVQAMRETVEYDRFKREEEEERIRKQKEEFEARDKATRYYSVYAGTGDYRKKSSVTAAGFEQSRLFEQASWLYGRSSLGFQTYPSVRIPWFNNIDLRIHSKSVVRGAGNRYEMSLTDTSQKPAAKFSYRSLNYTDYSGPQLNNIQRDSTSLEITGKPVYREGDAAYYRDMYYFQGMNAWLQNLSFHYGFRLNVSEISYKNAYDWVSTDYSSSAGGNPYPYMSGNLYISDMSYEEIALLFHAGAGYEKELFKNNIIDFKISLFAGPGLFRYVKHRVPVFLGSGASGIPELLHIISAGAYPETTEGRTEVSGVKQEIGYTYNAGFLKIRAHFQYSDGIHFVRTRTKINEEQLAWFTVNTISDGSLPVEFITSDLIKKSTYDFREPDPRDTSYGFGLGVEIPF